MLWYNQYVFEKLKCHLKSFYIQITANSQPLNPNHRIMSAVFPNHLTFEVRLLRENLIKKMSNFPSPHLCGKSTTSYLCSLMTATPYRSIASSRRAGSAAFSLSMPRKFWRYLTSSWTTEFNAEEETWQEFDPWSWDLTLMWSYMRACGCAMKLEWFLVFRIMFISAFSNLVNILWFSSLRV